MIYSWYKRWSNCYILLNAENKARPISNIHVGRHMFWIYLTSIFKHPCHISKSYLSTSILPNTIFLKICTKKKKSQQQSLILESFILSSYLRIMTKRRAYLLMKYDAYTCKWNTVRICKWNTRKRELWFSWCKHVRYYTCASTYRRAIRVYLRLWAWIPKCNG